MNKRIVFLTRRLDSYENLINELEKKEIELRGFPFIETTSVPFDNDLEAVDWLFFLSPASVIHFFEQVSAIPENLKLAALGPGTAAMFPQGIKPRFVGQHADTAETGKDFAKILGTGRMFFVRGPKTSGRVQQMIPQEQRSPLICYDTAPVKTKLDFKPEVVVFSSPSNAEAFLISNKWERDMKAVAFGNTTALALENLGIMPVRVSENTDENSLLKAIFVALGV